MREEPKAEKDWRYKIGHIKSFDRIKSTKAFNAVYRKADKTWHTPSFVLFYKKDSRQEVGLSLVKNWAMPYIVTVPSVSSVRFSSLTATT